jgi:hypothetical protein
VTVIRKRPTPGSADRTTNLHDVTRVDLGRAPGFALIYTNNDPLPVAYDLADWRLSVLQ